MIGNHIVSSPDFSCVADILLLGIEKLGIRNAAVALPACDKSAMIGFLRIFYIVNGVRNGGTEGAPLSNMQGYQTGGCDSGFPPKRKDSLPKQTVLCVIQICPEIDHPRTNLSCRFLHHRKQAQEDSAVRSGDRIDAAPLL